MSDHYPGCWLYHMPCAHIRIRELEAEILTLKQSCFDTQSGPIPIVDKNVNSEGICQLSILTHPTVVPCGSVGPTWSSPHDDPPSHTI